MRLAALLALCLAFLAGCSQGGESGAVTVTATTTTTTAATPAGESGTARDDEALFGRIPEIVRKVEPSVVAVAVDNGEGSGVVWDADGTVVTNNHVVEGSERVEIVFANGERAQGRVLATDPLTDLAVVKLERDSLTPARFSQELPRVGELAVAIGNPLGLENTVTAGIVSGLHRTVPGGPETQALVDLIQTDAPISPGNSGGALVDARGRVIGINVAYIPPELRAVSIGFAIPSSTVVDIVTQLLEDGKAQHAYLGVQLAELTPQLAERFDIRSQTGVLVLEVVEDSAADRAGMRAGDVIVSVDGSTMRRVEDVLALLRQRSPGDEINVRLVRDGDERTLAIKLIDRPE